MSNTLPYIGRPTYTFKCIGHPILCVTEDSENEQCCPPDCCDMRGMLTFQILWELRNGPLNGQQIAEQIAMRRGSKPTPGTIYPALKDLEDRGTVKSEKEGRQRVYSLTEAGIAGYIEAARYFNQVFGDIAEDAKVIVMKTGDCSKC
jgi:PadR family transcriptional regulator PadR